MSMPIDVETLLNRQRIESERIEFKRGWNPTGIYRTICAFANDFENLGGGYILVGVEQDERGVAKRPVVGIEDGDIDGILKDMVAYNNKFDPFYQPRTFVESIDGKKVLAIWVPSGAYRPYAVPTENRMLKNVAAMMFCENPEKFFKYMQVDVVVFPEGRLRNPQRFIEKTFKGSVPQLIKQTMDYLRTNILFETVQTISRVAVTAIVASGIF